MERERGGEADALELAARERGRRAAEQVRGADGLERRSRAARDLARRRPEVLEPERDLRLDAGEHDLLLRVLEHRRDRSCKVGRAVASRVEAVDLDATGEAAPVEVRHEPGERAEERRLPRARRPEADDELAGLEPERDAVQRGPLRLRIREREPDCAGRKSDDPDLEF